MEVSKASIQKAVANNIISEQQGIALYNFFQEENQHTASFTFTQPVLTTQYALLLSSNARRLAALAPQQAYT